MERDQQIKLVESASQRASERASAWNADPRILEAARNDFAVVLRMKTAALARATKG
jgi:hypothetical protein